jgi:hypothetical protein
VLVQDTGLGDWLPLGRGVVAFRDVDEALAGVEAINGDYQAHRQGARRVAEEIFSAHKVLPALVGEAVA